MNKALFFICLLGWGFLGRIHTSVAQAADKAVSATPTPADIDAALAEAVQNNRIIPISGKTQDIPALLRQIVSLPAIFRTTLSGHPYDVVVMRMNVTPTGATLQIGSRFRIPDSQQDIYFYGKDIPVSGKSGFFGELKLLPAASAPYEEFVVPGFQEKLRMQLQPESALAFSCGNFTHFSLTGTLLTTGLTRLENAQGVALPDQSMSLRFSQQAVSDWKDMMLDATLSGGFQSITYADLGFHFTDNAPARVDLSQLRNPDNLPACARTQAEAWKGIALPRYSLRVPRFIQLRSGVSFFAGTGQNIFLDASGLVGTVSATQVYSLTQAYTGTKHEYNLSVESLTANFDCSNQVTMSMLGKIQVPWCGTQTGQAPTLWYSCRYTNNRYEFFVKDTENGTYTTNRYTFPDQSTLTFDIADAGMEVLTTLPDKPVFQSNAYQNSICKDFPVTLTASGCSSNLIWNTGDTGSTVTLKPQQTTTYAVECRNQYCIGVTSDSLRITVYESLPQPSLLAGRDVLCTYENTALTAGNCVGKLEWKNPGVASFSVLGNEDRTQTVNWPGVAQSQTYTYAARCNLNGCLSPEQTRTLTVHPEPATPVVYSNAPNNTIDRGGSVTIGGNCQAGEQIVWENLPQPTVTLSGNATYVAYCTNPATGCSSRNRANLTIQVLYLPPASPSPLSVSSSGIDYVDLVWRDESSNEDGYRLWRYTSPDLDNPQLLAQLGPNQTSYRHQGLSEGHTYYYRVAVYNKYDELWSNTATGQTLVRPSAPQLTADRSMITRGSSVQVSGSCSAGSLVWLAPQGYQGGSRQQFDNTTYTAQCVNNGLSGPAASYTVQVCDLPAASVSVNDLTLTAGTSGTLIANGCAGGSLRWNTGQTSSSIGVSSAGQYTVTCTLDNSCGRSTATATATVRVNDRPCDMPSPLPIWVDDITVAPGSSGWLRAQGCNGGEISWSNGQGGRDIYVSAGYYTATCTVTNACGNSARSSDGAQVSDGQRPTAEAIWVDDITVAPGSRGWLRAQGCPTGQITWSNGAAGRDIEVPAGYYTATCTVSNQYGSVSSSDGAQVSDGQLPTAESISVEDITVAPGSRGWLRAQGCPNGQITWSNGAAGRDIEVPAGYYTATCTVSNQYGSVSSSDGAQVSDGQLPTAEPISVEDITVPYGGTGRLVAQGCPTGRITWNNGMEGREIDVRPGYYTATCTVSNQYGSVTSSDGAQVNEEPRPCDLPTPQLNAPDRVVQGTTVTIQAWGCPGGSTYRWALSGGVNESFTGPDRFNRTLPSTTQVAVSCQRGDCIGPENRKQINVESCNLPTPSVSYIIRFDKFLINKEVWFTINNCQNGASYIWEWPSDYRTEYNCSMRATFSDNTTFIVFAQKDGCTSPSAYIHIQEGAPTVNASQTVLCPGQSATFQLGGCSPGVYNWQKPSGQTETVWSSNATTSETGTHRFSCIGASATTSVHLSQQNVSQPSISGPTEVGRGQTVTLSASGCPGSYHWNYNETGGGSSQARTSGNEASGSTISLSLQNTTQFSVYCEQSACSGTSYYTVTVRDPTPQWSSSGSSCANGNGDLMIDRNPYSPTYGQTRCCSTYEVRPSSSNRSWRVTYTDCQGQYREEYNTSSIRAQEGTINCMSCIYENVSQR